MKARRIFGSE